MAINKLLSDNVTIKFYMFGSLMKSEILDTMNNEIVVTQPQKKTKEGPKKTSYPGACFKYQINQWIFSRNLIMRHYTTLYIS